MKSLLCIMVLVAVAFPGLPALAADLPPASAIVDAEQAERVLIDVRREKAANDAARRAARAECATRVLVNRCVLDVEQQHRPIADRLRALERHAQEVIREDRNRQRNEALAERENERRAQAGETRQREEQGRERELARQSQREERARATKERDRMAAENLARFEARQKARQGDAGTGLKN